MERGISKHDKSNGNKMTAEEKTLYPSSNSKGGSLKRNDRSKYINIRVFGYSVAAVVHLANIIAMFIALRGPIMKDPDIAHFYSMEFVYVTIWNLVFQLLYCAMGLACDGSILLNMKNYEILNKLRSYRKIYFSGILWPCGLVIFVLYWPIYIYDRNLIFPDYIDKVLNQVSNYIMHMFIAFPILWDLFFLPNQRPGSQKYPLRHCVLLLVIYLSTLFAHYGYRGKWPYPILKSIYGTLYFPLLFVFLVIVYLIIYYVQWPIISYIWNKGTNKVDR